EGFVISTRGAALVIAGPSRMGTINGVSAFLEEYLGVRWLWPGENGEVVPRLDTLRVGQAHSVQEPDFDIRGVGSGKWALVNRMNYRTREPDEFRLQWFVHSYLSLIPPATYLKSHPEYYAEADGARPDPEMDPAELKRKRLQICTSNPEVVTAAAQTIIGFLDRDPHIRMVSVDPEDSQGTFCQCDACRALGEKDAPYEARNSRRCLLFANRVAKLVEKKHPKVLIKMIAYHTTVAPPLDPTLKPRDNVAIQFCRFMDHNHALQDPASVENRAYHRDYLAWRQRTPNILFYEYYYKVSWLHLPWPIVHTLKTELPYLHKQGLLGVISQYGRNPATHATGYYVAAKLLWDAERDVDALMTDFYQKAYGGAVTPMRDYHESIERAAIQSGIEIAQQLPYVEMLELFTPELLARLDQCIVNAHQTAVTPAETARIEMVAKGLAHTHRLIDYLRTVDEVRRSGRQSRWAGGGNDTLRKEAKRRAGAQAEAIRAALEEPGIRSVVGGMNTYLTRALRPDSIVNRFTGKGGARNTAEISLDKASWLKEHPDAAPNPVPEQFDLWIYANDLDFVDGVPEHSLWVRTGEDKDVCIGRVGRKGSRGDRRTLCFKLTGLQASLLEKGELQLKITNDPGGPYSSTLFAIYLMPPTPELTEVQAGEQIERDAEQVREQAFGFIELRRAGVKSTEVAPVHFTIAVP
ncbi:MAG: DUF4838 domain-containing protein, partial [Lentisphaeria bacterium]|nr:DUF4838 domain-containing protein [Lentisphaeria bacterium]